MNFQLCIRLCTDVGIDPKDADAEGSCDVFQISSLFVWVNESVCAGAPKREHDPKICPVHEPVAVDVSTRECRADCAPEGEQYAKVAAIDNSIQIEIDVMARWTFADVGDAVGVGVVQLPLEDLAVVDDAS